MERVLLLAEQLALVAISEDSGHPRSSTGSRLNACLAGLLVAELALEGAVRPGDRGDAVVPSDPDRSLSPTLAAAARVVADKGPRIKAILSHMDRGLTREIGLGTWDAAVGGLVAAGVMTVVPGRLHPRYDIADPIRRDDIVGRLQAAAASDTPLDARTAVVLAMTGPAYLLEVVAPERGARRHARARIGQPLGGTFEAIRRTVVKLIAEAEAAAVAGSVAVTG
ncbi:MAG: GPP34 family phosphoprotein [Actinomycetota bacterium]|nr:GPP34 family phosphoprotein [Actinomycetota bacterium]